MTVDPGGQELLASWKEIATLLRVDKRTCARWEKSLGLPVHRMEGFNRSRVFAYKDEVETWAREKLNDRAAEGDGGYPAGSIIEIPTRTTAVRHPSKRGMPLVIAASAGAAILIAAAGGSAMARNPLLHFWKDRQPARITVAGNTLEVLNESGQLLWYSSFPQELHDQYSSIHLCADIDGDGRNEVLWSCSPWNQEAPDTDLVCYSSRGRELWRFSPRRALVTAARPFPPEYLVRAIRAFHGPDGGTLIALLSTNTWDPCQVTLLDAAGNSLGEYWNHGHFNADAFIVEDFDGDGRREILAAGENNAYNRACLAVLDTGRIEGTAPQKDIPEHAFSGFPEGREKRYVLFPRSLLCDTMAIRNKATSVVLRPEERLIEVTVTEFAHCAVKYFFDYGFRLVSVVPEDAYRAKVKELQSLGVINAGGLDDFEALCGRVVSWSGEAWVPAPRAERER